jgi:hypothetical protein
MERGLWLDIISHRIFRELQFIPTAQISTTWYGIICSAVERVNVDSTDHWVRVNLMIRGVIDITIKVSRHWANNADAIRLMNQKGEFFCPPLFAMSYSLTSQPVRSWFLPIVNRSGFTLDLPDGKILFEEARNFAKFIKQHPPEQWPSVKEKTAEGIQTMFNGIYYRSRLEARWAAFFNLQGWDAHYEPFDLKGYIPDFVLHGKSDPTDNLVTQIIVEVKPVTSMDDPLFKETVRKIQDSGWEHEALIVSYFLPAIPDNPDISCIGWLREGKDRWGLAPFHSSYKSLGFHGCGSSSYDRITGIINSTGTFSQDPKIKSCWLKSLNLVQWKP